MRDNTPQLEPALDRVRAAARNAVSVCLALQPDEHFVVICDATTHDVASALLEAAQAVGASVERVALEDVGTRPLPALPAALSRVLERAAASCMAVSTPRGELTFRRCVLELVSSRRIRHAHMPGVTLPVFVDGLSVDYRRISRFIARLTGRLSAAGELRLCSAGGTDLRLTYASPSQIVALDGIIDGSRWQNLPSGQVIVFPSSAAGAFVVDQAIGDWFEREYDVREHPVRIEFEAGAVKSLSCDNPRLERELALYLRSSPNSGRISELVIGANTELVDTHSAALFQDQLPGVSLNLGAQPGETTPGNWTSSTSVGLIAADTTLYVGDALLLERDTFAAELTDGL